MIKRLLNYAKWLSREFIGHKTTEDIYNEIAENVYENVIDYQSRVFAFKKALQQVDMPKKMLDLATGTGAMIDGLPSKKDTEIIALDISENMLKVARKRFNSFKNIVFKNADMLKEKFPENSFDLITVGFAGRFIPKEKEELFAQNLTKWLKKDGTFLIVLMKEPQKRIAKLGHVLTGFPKGFNVNMEFEEHLIKILKPYLTFEKAMTINKQFFIFKSVALFFKKK